MFPDQIVKSRVKKLQKLWKKRENSRHSCRKLLHMANASWAHMLTPLHDESVSHAERKPIQTINVIGAGLERLSMLYKEPPIRHAANASEQAALEQLLWSEDYNEACERIDRVTRLCGQSASHVKWKAHPEEERLLHELDRYLRSDFPLEERFQITTQTADRYCYLPQPYDISSPIAIAVKVSSHERLQSSGELISDVTSTSDEHIYYDEQYTIRLRDWKPISVEHVVEHGLGVLPWTINHFEKPTDLDDVLNPRPWAGHDLPINVENITRLLREIHWTTLFLRGQPCATEDANVTHLGPDTLVRGPKDSFWVVKHTADVAQMIQTLEVALRLLARDMSLPTDSFVVKTSSSASSGIAIAMREVPLIDARKKAMPRMGSTEQRISRVAAEVYNSLGGVQTLTGEVSVEYRREAPVLTFDERMKRVGFELKHGLISKTQAVRELHPELNSEQIEQRLQEAREDPASANEERPPGAAPEPRD